MSHPSAFSLVSISNFEWVMTTLIPFHQLRVKKPGAPDNGSSARKLSSPLVPLPPLPPPPLHLLTLMEIAVWFGVSLTRRSLEIIPKWMDSLCTHSNGTFIESLKNLLFIILQAPVGLQIELSSTNVLRQSVARSVGSLRIIGPCALSITDDLTKLERQALAIFVFYKHACFSDVDDQERVSNVSLYSGFRFNAPLLERAIDRPLLAIALFQTVLHQTHITHFPFFLDILQTVFASVHQRLKRTPECEQYPEVFAYVRATRCRQSTITRVTEHQEMFKEERRGRI